MPHLSPTEEQALALFKERLQRQFPGRLEELLLFGSKARGDDTPESDVDLLVVIGPRADWKTRRRIIRLASDIFLKTGVDVSPRVYSREQIAEMRRRRAMFLQSVERDAIPV